MNRAFFLIQIMTYTRTCTNHTMFKHIWPINYLNYIKKGNHIWILLEYKTSLWPFDAFKDAFVNEYLQYFAKKLHWHLQVACNSPDRKSVGVGKECRSRWWR